MLDGEAIVEEKHIATRFDRRSPGRVPDRACVSFYMAKKRYTAEQIISHLRKAEILISEGKPIRDAARQNGISEQTYYRWRKEYGGMDISQARRLKELETENQRLNKLVADQALDIEILKEVNRGNF
jgi:transposase-like protein